MPFHDEPYEAMTAVMTMIDTAADMLNGIEGQGEVVDDLNGIRNLLNARRISLLGGEVGKRPWHVSDLELPTTPTT